MPIVADNGDVYLFFRRTKGSVNRPTYYVKSTDNAQSWSKAKPAIEHEQLRDDDYNEIYLGAVHRVHDNTHGERFLLVWTLAGGGGIHNFYHYGCFAAAFDPSDEHYYSPGGVDLGIHIDALESEEHCLVESTRKDYNWQIGHLHMSLATDNGDMVVFYLRDKNAQNMVKCARWKDDAWDITEVNYTGNKNTDGFFGAEKFGPESFRIYYSVHDSNNVRVKATNDGGRNWESEGDLKLGFPIDQCQIIPGYKEDLKLLLTEMSDDYNGKGKVWAAAVDNKVVYPLPPLSRQAERHSLYSFQPAHFYDLHGRLIYNEESTLRQGVVVPVNSGKHVLIPLIRSKQPPHRERF